MSIRVFVALFCFFVLAGVGCDGQGVGDTCAWEGSGFTASHNCRVGLFCLRTVSCPDGKQVEFSKCVGTVCSNDASCGEGKICVKYSDQKSYCVDTSVCPSS